MFTAKLHTYSWASDLHQWIPFYNTHVTLKYTGKGNLMTVNFKCMGKYWDSDHSTQMVFNKDGVCVSHTPSKKALAKGALSMWPRLSNIVKI